jgi:hypothetical protein
LEIEASPFNVDVGVDVLMISFNGDEVDCTLDREVAGEIVKLPFFIVDETIAFELDFAIHFDGATVFVNVCAVELTMGLVCRERG